MTATLTRPSDLAVHKSVELDENKVARDRYQRPLIIVPGEDKPKPYTRTTTFVDCLEDKTSLADWGKRMVLVGAAKDPHALLVVPTLDPDDKQDKKRLNALAEQMMETSGANEKREKGTFLHHLSEFVDSGEKMPACSIEDLADMAAYEAATEFIVVRDIERLVVLDAYSVAGTPDRVSWYEGKGPDGEDMACNLITDLKTGNVEYGGLKMAGQLAVYANGEFYNIHTGERESLPDVNRDWGLIMNLRPGSAEVDLFWVDLRIGWRAVEMAWDIRELRKKGRKALIPFAA